VGYNAGIVDKPAGNGVVRLLGSAISWRVDIVGILGVTLLVMILLWPAIGGGRTLMSDSWKLNYPWAVEGVTSWEYSEMLDVGEAGFSIVEEVEPVIEEPYIHAYDIYLECIPWYQFAQEELSEGRWPHWNPYVFCGSPLYANHLIPLTHPPLIIALLTAPLYHVHTVATFLTWWLGGLGLYLFLRSKRLQPAACLTAVALYLASGHYMPLVPFQMAGLMYYPWLMWASDALEARPSFRTIAPLSILLGLQLAAGHPAYVAPFVYLLILHRILIWIFRKRPKSWWIPRLGYLLVAFVLGGCLSAIQNVPTLEYLQQTPRQLAGEVERTVNAEAGPDVNISDDSEGIGSKLAIPFAPVFRMDIETLHPYVGIPMILLAIMGLLFYRPPAEKRAMAVLLLFFLLLSYPPIFARIAPYIPGLGLSPYNPYAPVQFLLAIFAAVGLNGLMFPESERSRALRTVFAWAAIPAVLIFAWPFVSEAILNPDTRWEREQIVLAWVVLLTGIVACVLPSIALWYGRKRPSLGGLWLPLVLTVAGIAGHYYQYPVFPRMQVMPEVTSIGTLPQSEMYRMIRHSSKSPLHAGSLDNPLTFGGNLPMWAGMMDSQGYDSFVPEKQWDMLTALDPESMAWNGLAFPITEPGAVESPLLDAMAVKWVISDDPALLEKPESGMNPEEWRLLFAGGLNVYEKRNAFPRWYLSRDAVYVEDHRAAIEYIQSEGLGDINQPVVVLSGPEAAEITKLQAESDRIALNPAVDRISLVESNPQMLEFRVDVSEDYWFVLSDTFYPEWKAYLDGAEVLIFPANGAYRAVRISETSSDLVFRYEPATFAKGGRISLIALILLIAGLAGEAVAVRMRR